MLPSILHSLMCALSSGARFDSAGGVTANSINLRSSFQNSPASLSNETVKRPDARPKSCSNASRRWVNQHSSDTESTADRVRPASAVLVSGGKSSRYATIPSILQRGSRLLSAPVSQASLLLSEAGPMQLVISKHSEQPKSHVTDTFAKVG